MPDNVSFSGIPLTIRLPGAYLEVDPLRAVSGLPSGGRQLLVLGQRLATGTVAAGAPTRVTSAVDAVTYFGRGSMLARMCAALFRTDGQYCDVWAIALDDLVSGVAHTRTLTVAGTVSSAGTLAVYICGVRVAIAVPGGQAAATTATALAAAITATVELPVTAAAALGVVTMTVRHKGECGNDLDVRHSYYTGEGLPAGMTVATGMGVVGSGNPDVTTALAAMAGRTWDSIVMPWTDSANMVILETELESRWGPMQQRTGHAFSAKVGTFSALSTYGAARNSPHCSCLGMPSSPCWAPEVAAAWAGVVEFQGASDPARGFQTLALPGIMAPAEAARFSWSEKNLLAYDGISVVEPQRDGTVTLLTVLTNYQTTPAGVETAAFLKLNTKWTVDYVRHAVRERILLRFPRHKLTSDGTRYAAGQAIVTPKIIKAELVALGDDLEMAGIVEHMNAADITVVRSDSDVNRVNAILAPNIVNQFDVFAAAIQFVL